jgi:hypothetical protein
VPPSKPTVQWPTSAVSENGADLLEPLSDLLLNLNVLEGTDANGAPLQPGLLSTPFSLQVITAGSTSISKWIGTTIAGLGGVSTVLAGLRAFAGGLDDTVKVGWAAAAAACLIATIIGLAVILRADVSGRATATAAEYAARSLIAAQFLALARPQGQYFAKQPGYDEPFVPVQAFVLDKGQIKVQVDGQPLLDGASVEGLVPVPTPS